MRSSVVHAYSSTAAIPQSLWASVEIVVEMYPGRSAAVAAAKCDPWVVHPTSVTYSETEPSPSERIASLAARMFANTPFGVEAYGWIATPSTWFRSPGSVASIACRNHAGRRSPPTITCAPDCWPRIALLAAPYSAAYAAGFGEGCQKSALSGSYQIS